MPRITSFVDIPVVSQRPLNGPEAVSGSQNTTIGNFTQSVASAFGGWVWEFVFPPMEGEEYRHFRGWLVAQQKGANITRWQMTDRDLMPKARAGVSDDAANMPWSNGMKWSNGMRWGFTYPNVPAAAPAALDASIITLADTFWGHNLKWGDRIGFFPFHFGLYQVTQELGDGRYRIWPPLRKAVTTIDFATLYPVMAMGLMMQDFEYPTEEQSHTTGATVRMREIFDYDARDYFTD
jgi:hypothetical protein